MRRGAGIAAVALALTLVAGCAPGGDGGVAPAPEGTEADLSGTLTVFAAASLTETFDALAETFRQQHPSAEVVLNYAGSSALAQQILAGAPADVFAAANEEAMQPVLDEGLALGAPVVFATNTLQLVVPAGNPGGVASLTDLSRDELAIALCDPAVPCGAAAAQLLQSAGVTATPDTLEEDVKAVVTKVLLGEADAGLVYVSDVRSAGDEVTGIRLDEADQAVNRYPVAVVAGAAGPALAEAWIALLTGDEGRRVLAEAGFGAP